MGTNYKCLNLQDETMRIRIFPLRQDLLIIQNICDDMGITLEVGAGLPEIYGTLDGWSEWADGTKREDSYKWQTAYLVVKTERQPIICLARLRNQVRNMQSKSNNEVIK